MNQKLAAMLAAVGIVVVGGTKLAVYIVQQGVARADLVDAGANGVCRAYVVKAEGLCDTPGGGRDYRAGRFRVAFCNGSATFGTDAGIVLPRRIANNCEIYRWDLIKPILLTDGGCGDSTLCQAGVNDGDGVDDAFDCACAPVDGGICTVTLPDGGTAQAPIGTTVGVGYQLTAPTGAGCIPKACSELFGVSSMPDGCR